MNSAPLTTEGFDRRVLTARLLAERGSMLVVSGLGSAAWDISAAGDTPLNFPLWGAMGGAVPIGLGLALAQPERRVLVITGDGEMLMGVGALATVAVLRPTNLAVCVLDNRRYGETGGQDSHTGAGVDLAGIAASSGFPVTLRVGPNGDVDAAITALRTQAGPVFANIAVSSAPTPLVLPPRDGATLKDRFRLALGVA
jgi:thiamine pyrophosphate-dependent acetolactate synthase large subunit-like protein